MLAVTSLFSLYGSYLVLIHARLTGAGCLIILHASVACECDRTYTLTLSTVPHSAWATLQTFCPAHTVLTLTLTSVTHPQMLLPTLRLLPPAPTRTLHLILHLHTGALLLTLPPTHRTLAQYHRDLSGPGEGGHTGLVVLMAASTAPLHCHMGGGQLVHIRVVRPWHNYHLVTGLAGSYSTQGSADVIPAAGGGWEVHRSLG